MHRSTRLVAVGMGGFIAENLILSHYRQELVERLGEENYHTFYSGLSTLAMATVGAGILFSLPASAPLLRSASSPTSPLFRLRCSLGDLLKILGIAGLSQVLPRFQPPVQMIYQSNKEPIDHLQTQQQQQQQEEEEEEEKQEKQEKTQHDQGKKKGLGIRFAARCPIDFKAEDRHKKQRKEEEGGGKEREIEGMERITRHPNNWSLGIFGAGAALAAKRPAAVVLGSSFLLWAYIGSAHQDYRFRRGSGGLLSPQRESVTSNVPFVALLLGLQPFSPLLDELKPWNALLAIISFLFFRRLTRSLLRF
jgi:hypothetical protein